MKNWKFQLDDSAGQTQPLIFFDGYCHLCNFWVNWLLRVDRHRKLRFAPLQGETAQQVAVPLPQSALPESIVVLENDFIYLQSRALLRIFRHLPYPWKGLLVLKIFPTTWLDKIYNWVARHRYRWFGRRSQCRLPEPSVRKRFLP